jgi:phenylacetate-coenzyme A ligase PaaK-like adenylate-forming protein
LKPLADSIFNICDDASFTTAALNVFHHQAHHNELYTRYIQHLKVQPQTIYKLQDIPFLPIEFFKSHKILTGNGPVQQVFSSSGTTGMVTSKHYVKDVEIYEKSYLQAFQRFYGNPDEYCILGLLPSYLEREGSSLIYMVKDLIRKSKHVRSGFYLHNYDELLIILRELEAKRQRTILLGVTYALLDLAERYKAQAYPGLQYVLVMETGGMKGKRKEMIREELHGILCSSFGVPTIHSEYGMTELLSQAYSKGGGRFFCPPWMRVLIRDSNDPFTSLSPERTGGVNIIDLANIHSCSFIATQDLGKMHSDGSFEILGRFDNSDIRGCNLMVL